MNTSIIKEITLIRMRRMMSQQQNQQQLNPQQQNRLKIQIQKAIRDPDCFALHFIYITDDKVSIRAVSPYRWNGNDGFTGLCLSRQSHRSFRLDRIHKLSLVESSELLMPYPSEGIAIQD